MLPTSLRYIAAALAAISALEGTVLALNSVQYLIEQFRFTATVTLLATSAGFLFAAVLLVRRARGGPFVAAACVVGALLLIVGGLSHMGNVSLWEAARQATCMPLVAMCFPQAATFIYWLAALCVALVASHAASAWPPSTRGA
jgi:hypothetical protein